MSENATKSSSGESGKRKDSKPVEVKYVNKSFIDKYYEKHKIKIDAVMFESSREKILDDSNVGSSSDSNTSAAGSHTKIETSVEHKLAFLFKHGFLQIATKEQTPKIKRAKVKETGKKEDKPIDKDAEKE